MFQFLIGIVKTALKNPQSTKGRKFQFLIGIVKTEKTRTNKPDWTAFQFLIGIVKTKGNNNNKRYVFRVSIPYRYSKDAAMAVATVSAICPVSIPYRYSKDRASFSPPMPFKTCFNSL